MNATARDPAQRHTFVVRTSAAGSEVSVTNVATDERARLPSLKLVAGQLEQWIAEAHTERAPNTDDAPETA